MSSTDEQSPVYDPTESEVSVRREALTVAGPFDLFSDQIPPHPIADLALSRIACILWNAAEKEMLAERGEEQ